MTLKIDRNRYLTYKEAAQKSGYTYDHVRKLVRDGVVQAIEPIEGMRLVDWQDVERYMATKPERGIRGPFSARKKNK